MSSGKTQDDVLADIADKLNGILGFMAVRGMNGDIGQMLPRLKEIGLSTKMMSLITGISENAVAIRLSRMKNPPAKKPKGKAKKKVSGVEAAKTPATDTATDSAQPDNTASGPQK